MNTKEELNALKVEYEAVKLSALTDEDLMQVSGGVAPCPVSPSLPSRPSTTSESVSVPIKGETTVHIDASVRDGEVIIKEY